MSKNHFSRYTNLQRVKHELIRRYVNAWLPKLTTGRFANSKVLYFDTHAGPGVYKTGEQGSPLVAVTTISKHQCLSNVSGEIYCCFIEKELNAKKTLESEISKIKCLPNCVKVHIECGDSFQLLDDVCDYLEKEKASLAPSLVFCDPFTFDIPLDVLVKMMSYRSVEVFLNVIWRELLLGLGHAFKGTPTWVEKYNRIFGTDDWMQWKDLEPDERVIACADMLRQKFRAKHHTFIRMQGSKGATKYFLLHLTNHDQGKIEMKNAIWAVCPDGGYYASQKESLEQQLIEIDPNLEPLQDWVVQQLLKRPLFWQDLCDRLIPEIWLDKHLKMVLVEMRRNGEILASEYDGRFAKSNNPLLELKK